MYICFIYLFIYLFICYLFICLFIYLFIYLLIYLFIYLFLNHDFHQILLRGAYNEKKKLKNEKKKDAVDAALIPKISKRQEYFHIVLQKF